MREVGGYVCACAAWCNRTKYAEYTFMYLHNRGTKFVGPPSSLHSTGGTSHHLLLAPSCMSRRYCHLHSILDMGMRLNARPGSMYVVDSVGVSLRASTPTLVDVVLNGATTGGGTGGEGGRRGVWIGDSNTGTCCGDL